MGAAPAVRWEANAQGQGQQRDACVHGSSEGSG